jgi:hypothetical protein
MAFTWESVTLTLIPLITHPYPFIP